MSSSTPIAKFDSNDDADADASFDIGVDFDIDAAVDFDADMDVGVHGDVDANVDADAMLKITTSSTNGRQVAKRCEGFTYQASGTLYQSFATK